MSEQEQAEADAMQLTTLDSLKSRLQDAIAAEARKLAYPRTDPSPITAEGAVWRQECFEEVLGWLTAASPAGLSLGALHRQELEIKHVR